MRRNFLPLLLVLLVAGCAATPPEHPFTRPANLFPPDGVLVQRVLFTARGRQFPLNGYLALNEAGGKHLVVTENFGNVMAELLIKPDGQVFVLRSSRMFPERYIRRLMAEDVKCVFGGTPKLDCPVTMPETNRFVLDRGAYKLDIRIVETKAGVQPAAMFEEPVAVKQ
ncbi:MAG TPA: hypothetical protein VG347_01060 [Verrucomicrobiae bacterium]|nr:hypothetical protein [Verrucomicrobiae bacterium]